MQSAGALAPISTDNADDKPHGAPRAEAKAPEGTIRKQLSGDTEGGPTADTGLENPLPDEATPSRLSAATAEAVRGAGGSAGVEFEGGVVRSEASNQGRSEMGDLNHS